jgi:hypothetical protein
MPRKIARCQQDMFSETFEDLPLFSGTPPTVPEPVFNPQPVSFQATMPGMERDWEETRQALRQMRQAKALLKQIRR